MILDCRFCPNSNLREEIHIINAFLRVLININHDLWWIFNKQRYNSKEILTYFIQIEWDYPKWMHRIQIHFINIFAFKLKECLENQSFNIHVDDSQGMQGEKRSLLFVSCSFIIIFQVVMRSQDYLQLLFSKNLFHLLFTMNRISASFY